MNYTYRYPHPAVAADCLVFGHADNGETYLLLIQRKNEPCKGQWAFPGGFMNIDETAEQAVVRELAEETTIRLSETDVFQIGAYTAVDRDPRERVVTIAYFAEIEKPVKAKGSDDASRAQWFPLDALPPLAFDHAEILQDAMVIRSGEC